MRCIIDGGGTTLNIALVEKENGKTAVDYNQLPGFNPQLHDWETFKLNLEEWIFQSKAKPGHVEYYGAGLSEELSRDKMRFVLSNLWDLQERSIHVFSDLQLAAHAAWQGQPVIVGILGTGSNVGFYDGKSLTQRTRSLGYLLADEGGGIDLCRRMLLAYQYDQLSETVQDYITGHYEYTADEIIDYLYRRRQLKQYISPLKTVINKFIDDHSVQSLIQSAFSTYIENRLMPEMKHQPNCQQFHFFGGVASSYPDVLKRSLKVYGIENVSIDKSPLKVYIDLV